MLSIQVGAALKHTLMRRQDCAPLALRLDVLRDDADGGDEMTMKGSQARAKKRLSRRRRCVSQRGGKEGVHAESCAPCTTGVVRRESGNRRCSSERPRQIVGELVG